MRHVSHSFGPHWALKDCSFSLDKGDFLFLSGPSGAGKTTLLRLLYAGLPLQRGDAKIAGINLKKIGGKKVADLRRQVGVVFQDFKILPLRSVQENIALPLEIRGLAPQHIDRRVRAVSRVLGLESRLDVPCGLISGGEQQRVAIARAFVVNPQVLLADEPTGNLDPILSLRLMELFKQFQAYGTTVIFATHSKELMRRHPTARIMRLEEGFITHANWPGATVRTKNPDEAPTRGYTVEGQGPVHPEHLEQGPPQRPAPVSVQVPVQAPVSPRGQGPISGVSSPAEYGASQENEPTRPRGAAPHAPLPTPPPAPAPVFVPGPPPTPASISVPASAPALTPPSVLVQTPAAPQERYAPPEFERLAAQQERYATPAPDRLAAHQERYATPAPDRLTAPQERYAPPTFDRLTTQHERPMPQTQGQRLPQAQAGQLQMPTSADRQPPHPHNGRLHMPQAQDGRLQMPLAHEPVYDPRVEREHHQPHPQGQGSHASGHEPLHLDGPRHGKRREP